MILRKCKSHWIISICVLCLCVQIWPSYDGKSGLNYFNCVHKLWVTAAAPTADHDDKPPNQRPNYNNFLLFLERRHVSVSHLGPTPLIFSPPAPLWFCSTTMNIRQSVCVCSTEDGVCVFPDVSKKLDGLMDAPGQLFAKVRTMY